MPTHSRLLRLTLPLLAVPLVVATVRPETRREQAPPAAAAARPTDPWLSTFRFRSIGPASMGGRIDDIAVSETDPSTIYLGYATGGVFKSENNGTTFEPVFEAYGTSSIGDIAIHPTNPNIVYVGTGEPNNRQSSSFGDGIYKTTDGGVTFTNVGLRETQTIARIVIDPKNPEVVYVASPGHLFGPNPERGVFKSTDGGANWIKITFIDDDTGFTDLAIDPSNTRILYAASYQRRRSGCCFNGGGPGSAVWKTTDAGRTWRKLTGTGLPSGTYGRIALDVSRSNPNVVYIQIETGPTGAAAPARGADPTASTEPTPPGAAAVGGAGVTAGAAATTAATPAGGGRGGYNWCNNGGPEGGYGRGAVTQAAPPIDTRRSGIFRSDNKGASWTPVSNCNARPMYFSQIRVDPSDDKAVYVAGLPVAKSLDGGRTFTTLDAAGGNGDPAHVDHHAIWIDPRNSKHLLAGNDGGLNISWDQGKTWDFVNTMATAQAYWVTADMRRPYYVYIGLQDNGSWGGPSATRSGNGILNSDWFGIGGGDGFQTAVDPTDYNVVYTESQDGNTTRYDLRNGRSQSIRPRGPGERGRGGFAGGAPTADAPATVASPAAAVPAATPAQPGAATAEPRPPAVSPQAQAAPGGGRGGAPNVLNAGPSDTYRFNWNTPFLLSPHNPSIIWLGGNRLFKSYNRGDTWVASEDLTKRIDRNTVALMGVPGDRAQLSKNDGVVSYSTIIAISESPIMPGIVWAGTDDGNVQVSRDAGATFTEVGRALPGLPPNHQYWISRIDASHFDPATAYVSVDGHRSDDLKPYLFVTRDYGTSWQSLVNNLPAFGNIQVVREDPKNRNLLYVGTEFGLYISIDGGRQWQKFMNNLPTARVDDILVHPRDGDLIVATHARSIWIADDVTPLQQLPAATSQEVALFDVRPAVAWLPDRQRGQQTGGQRMFVGQNPERGTTISYYLKSAAAGDVKLTITDATGRTIRTFDGGKDQGIHRVHWNLLPSAPAGRGARGGGRGAGTTVDPGTYIVTLTANGTTITKPRTVLQDYWLNER
jgi:photosystem II stability/assembly factor-like uncharacterized protein